MAAVALIVSAADDVTVNYGSRDGLSSDIVGSGVQDSRGLLWFATWNGLDCYDGYDFHRVTIRPGDKSSISTNLIRDILLDGDEIICRTDGDIYAFDLTSYTFGDISPERKAELRPKVGRRWRGMTDSQGNFWTADHSGLHKRFRPHHPATWIPGTENSVPRSFMTDGADMLWIGTTSPKGITVVDLRRDSVVSRIPLSFTPYVIFRHSGGDIWTGGKPGGFGRAGEQPISDDIVYDIAEDSSGRLWIATFGEGVKCVEAMPDGSHRISKPLAGRKVRRLLITPSGNLVAATTEGLLTTRILPDVTQMEFRPVKRDGNDASSLVSDATMDLAMDSKGNIYVSTESSGLDMTTEESLFSTSPRFTHFNTTNSALTSDICKSMTLASDSLLIITGIDNVIAMNPTEGTVTNLSRQFWGDSCRFAETRPVCMADGSWVFGAQAGAVTATDHNIHSRGYIPPIVFTTVALDGDREEFRLPPVDTIALDASHRNATIGFAALDYVDNADIIYRTRLDRSPWTAGNHDRRVTLFNLTPGTHVFEVQSTDRFGRWVDNAASITITVAPFWYETWWARLLGVIAAAAAIAAVVYTYLYIRRVNRQRRELLEKYLALMNLVDTSKDETASDDAPVAEPEPLKEVRSPEDAAFLDRVRRYIEENIANPDANVDDMALAAAASRSTLNRRLNSMLGISAAKLLADARMQRACRLLEAQPPLPVAQVAEMCGYADARYFQRVFKKATGLTPAEYNKKG